MAIRSMSAGAANAASEKYPSIMPAAPAPGGRYQISEAHRKECSMQSADLVYVQHEYLVCAGEDVIKYILTLPEDSQVDARMVLDSMVRNTCFSPQETDTEDDSDF